MTVLNSLVGLVASDPRTREQAADELTDQSQWPPGDALLLCNVLALLRLAERDRGAQESQLHAMVELLEGAQAPVFAQEVLRQLGGEIDDPSQLEYLECLLDQ